MSVNHLSSKKLIAIAAAGLLAAGLARVRRRPLQAAAAVDQRQRAKTLVMESSPETTITDDFNPFVSTAAPQGMGATGLIYEPLLQFDLAAAAEVLPLAGDGLQLVQRRQVDHLHDPAGREVEQRDADDAGRRRLHLRPGEEERRDQPGRSCRSPASPRRVTTSRSTSARRSIWTCSRSPECRSCRRRSGQRQSSPTTFTDAKPVGTGPYVLKTFTPQGFTLTKNPSYWQASMVKVPKRLLPGL